MSKKKIEYYELKNGLQVVLYQNKRAPVVTVDVAYKVGSKDEAFDRTGMAHLFEHLMFEGTETIPKGEFDKICSLSGGTNNAYTSFDMTNYYMTLPSSQLETGLWLESDRMKNFKISQKALTNQKSVVIEEIKQTVDDQPYGLWRELMSGSAYSSDCSYSWEVQGRKEDVAKVSLKDANEFKEKFYTPDNAALVLAGDFKLKEAKTLIRKYFSNIDSSSTKFNRNKFYKKHLLNKSRRTFKDDVPNDAAFVAYHCEGFENDYFSYSDIAANILGAGRSSRLYESLVNQKKIASQTGCYIDKRENDSLFICYAFGNQTDVSKEDLLLEIEQVIKRFKTQKVSKDEFTKAKNQLMTQFAFENDSFSGIADNLAIHTLFYNAPERLFSLVDRYKNLRIKDLEASTNKIFSKKGIEVLASASNSK